MGLLLDIARGELPESETTPTRATPSQEAELRRLVPEQCRRYGERDVSRCLHDALADPVAALTTYRDFARRTVH